METKDCTGFKTRKLDRLLTRQYDYILAEANLTSPQFSLLRQIDRFGPIIIKELAIKMGIEHSTLCRNIKVVEKNGWVKTQAGEDARSRVVITTPKGNLVHQKAKILWERQQRHVISVLSKKDATALNQMLDQAIAKIEADLSSSN